MTLHIVKETETAVSKKLRLMNAAPKLLETLKWVYREGEKSEAIDCGDHCHNTCLWCGVREAIAKAEGGAR